MRLDAFLIADAATAADGKLFVHGGAITRITPSRFPWGQPLAFALMLVLDETDDPTASHALAIELKDSADNNMIPTGVYNLPPMADYGVMPGEVPAYAIAASYTQVVFPQEGMYEVRVSVDDAVMRDFKFPVVYSPTAS